jgi:tetratricopeptide (TPR) repeat protein
MGRSAEALKSFERAIELDPQHTNPWTSRGNCLLDLRDYEGAVSSFERALELDSNEWAAWSGKGEALGHLGRVAEAIGCLERAVSLAPGEQRLERLMAEMRQRAHVNDRGGENQMEVSRPADQPRGGSKGDLYVEFLRREGFTPEMDADGDVTFKYEGGFYLIFVNETDPGYFSMMYPNFWKISSPEELARAHRSAGEATRSTKVAKVTVGRRDDQVNATVECFLREPTDFREIFYRGLEAIQTAVKKFVGSMRNG